MQPLFLTDDEVAVELKTSFFFFLESKQLILLRDEEETDFWLAR